MIKAFKTLNTILVDLKIINIFNNFSTFVTKDSNKILRQNAIEALDLIKDRHNEIVEEASIEEASVEEVEEEDEEEDEQGVKSNSKKKIL